MKEQNGSLWRRLAAFFLDALLVLIIVGSTGIGAMMVLHSPSHFSLQAQPSFAAIVGLHFVFIYLLVYHVFCEYIVGQTLGMLLVSLEVRVGKKEQPTFVQALVRNIYLLPIFSIVPIIWFADLIYYLFNGKRLLEHLTQSRTVELWNR